MKRRLWLVVLAFVFASVPTKASAQAMLNDSGDCWGPEDCWGSIVSLRDTSDTWSGAPPGGWWVTPIHATLLPDGKVLATGWGRRDYINCQPVAGTRKNGTTFILDPDALTGDSLNVTPLNEMGENPMTDVLYCAAHVPLEDGRILYTGGSRYPNRVDQGPELGLKYARLYNPADNTFVRISTPMLGGPPGLEGVRWYNTNTRLADSSVLVTGGFTEFSGKGDLTNRSVELFDYRRYDQGQNPWMVLVQHGEGRDDMMPGAVDYTQVALLYRPTEVGSFDDPYARQAAMIGKAGKVLLFNYSDNLSGGQRFTIRPNGQRPGPTGTAGEHASGVLLPTGELLIMGGTDDATAAKQASIYDPYMDKWSQIDTQIGRNHSASVLLPDGTVLVVAGEGGFIGNRRQPQIIDPYLRTVANGTPWPENHERGYHSFALLLKDGRVLVGGGRHAAGGIGCEWPNVRIYSPAYLSKGPRPKLGGLEPIIMITGESAVRFTYKNGPITSVALMALGSTTHSFDHNQRYVPLDFIDEGDGIITITPPADSTLAPGGDYILFIINAYGAPSVGKYVRLQ